jgi:hypothetical protein
MYREYWYRSALNKDMVASLKDVYEDAISKAKIVNMAVMDIGCNDGTSLSFYPKNWFRVGFDPANNLAEAAKQHCNVFINNYFDGSVTFDRKFDIITSIAMFYDVPNPNKFVQDIKANLADTGVWIIQMTDLGSMIKANAFDNICHEHIAYYSLDVIRMLLYNNGMRIFDISHNNVNGMSVRLSICKDDTDYNNIYGQTKYYRSKLDSDFNIINNNDFRENCEIIKNKVVNFIRGEAKDNVCGIGASTKGNTLLQYFGLTNADIQYIIEVSEQKHGKKTLGTNIPIVSEKIGFEDHWETGHPGYLLILPWHFTNMLVEKHRDYLDAGGSFIVPLPSPCIINKNGRQNL